jgi:hypothetical protein
LLVQDVVVATAHTSQPVSTSAHQHVRHGEHDAQ